MFHKELYPHYMPFKLKSQIFGAMQIWLDMLFSLLGVDTRMGE